MTASDPPGPPAAALLRSFANTVDHETGTDDLRAPDDLTAWLREHGLLGPQDAADEHDLALALELREGLRAAMAAHHGAGTATETAIPQLDAAGAALPLRVGFDGTDPHLEPVDTGARGALARLLATVHDCRLEGVWRRLKICPADDCQWAFYDASKNRTRVWCAMGVCGNRTKTRAYRARKRDQPSG